MKEAVESEDLANVRLFAGEVFATSAVCFSVSGLCLFCLVLQSYSIVLFEPRGEGSSADGLGPDAHGLRNVPASHPNKFQILCLHCGFHEHGQIDPRTCCRGMCGSILPRLSHEQRTEKHG